jgi:hypothetical protein
MQNIVDVPTLPEYTSIGAALEFIEAEGLQAPPRQELANSLGDVLSPDNLMAKLEVYRERAK